ncbi:MAG: radical SAM protein [archaeon]
MKILFVIPWMKSLFGDERTPPGHPHLGIAYLSAVLKQEGHNVRVFDQGIEKDDSKLYSLIEDFKPNIIGITAFSYCMKFVKELINEIKKKSKAPIVIGGPHVAALHSEILQKTKADFAIKGEAENSFIGFLNNLPSGDFAKADGLIWKKPNGEIIENKDAAYIKDLDSIPFPDFAVFDFKRYNYYQNKTIPLLTSRGCPYGCNYCSVRLSMGRGFRPRSADNVISEITLWYNRGFTNFEFNDDCFSLDLGRAKLICRKILESKIKITWQLYNGIRVDRVDYELLLLMKKAGCIFISYGSESGVQDIINKIGKGIRLEQVEQAVNLTNKAGIKNSVNFIIGHPGETYSLALKSIRFASKLRTGFVNFYNVIPYPGTTLWDWIEKNGKWLYPKDYILENVGSRDLTPVFETNEFRRNDRIKALKLGFALYEKTIMKFRLGGFVGTSAYYFTRVPFVFRAARYIALENKFGNLVYNIMTGKSRK